jgi:hypothetical protein
VGWIRIDRVTWAERALWAALVAAAIAPVALKPSIDEVSRTYVDAINRGDVDAAMAVTAVDLVIRPIMGAAYRGPTGTRQVLEYRDALNERWRVLSWEDTGKEVHAGIEVTSDAWDLLGEHPRTTVILVVRNGKLLYELTRTDHRRMHRALRPFLRWAEEERPGELAAVWGESGFLWEPAAAGRLTALLREWRASRPGVAEQPSRGQG